MREISKAYFPNGQIMEQGLIDHLGKQGKWEFYSLEGGLKIEAEYLNDQYHGRFIRYFENGNIAVVSNYQNGLRDGKGCEYYENGKIKEEWVYISGEYNIINFWNAQGEQTLTNGTGKKVEVYGSGIDIFVQYYEGGQFIKEERISSHEYENDWS
jgi:antitoxin component YwqK of YwqJK toxin-antitoxin module